MEPITGEVRDRVDNRLAQEVILFIVGELRPDLGDLLGEDTRLWLRAEYGDVKGAIEDPWRFATRDGEPWFGDRDSEWETRLLSVELGAFVAGDPPDEWALSQPAARRKRRESGSLMQHDSGGFFARYTQFSRPQVMGHGFDTRETGFALQDGELTLYGAGFRYIGMSCPSYCVQVSANMIPFTGVTVLDLGPMGSTWGSVLAGGFDLRFSYPIQVVGRFAISPYAAFRADWLMPLLGNNFDADIYKITLWTPDYVWWGPSAGLSARF